MSSAGFISWVDSHLHSSCVWIGELIWFESLWRTVVLHIFFSLAFVHEKNSERFRLWVMSKYGILISSSKPRKTGFTWILPMIEILVQSGIYVCCIYGTQMLHGTGIFQTHQPRPIFTGVLKLPILGDQTNIKRGICPKNSALFGLVI